MYEFQAFTLCFSNQDSVKSVYPAASFPCLLEDCEKHERYDPGRPIFGIQARSEMDGVSVLISKTAIFYTKSSKRSYPTRLKSASSTSQNTSESVVSQSRSSTRSSRSRRRRAPSTDRALAVSGLQPRLIAATRRSIVLMSKNRTLVFWRLRLFSRIFMVALFLAGDISFFWEEGGFRMSRL
jgi:hypothetical protein